MMTLTIDDDRTFTDSEEAAAYIASYYEAEEGLRGFDKDIFIMETVYTLDRMELSREIRSVGRFALLASVILHISRLPYRIHCYGKQNGQTRARPHGSFTPAWFSCRPAHGLRRF